MPGYSRPKAPGAPAAKELRQLKMPRPTSKHRKVRLTLELPVGTREAIDRIADRTCAESTTEVIRRAVSLYAMVTTTLADRKATLWVKDADGTRQVLIV